MLGFAFTYYDSRMCVYFGMLLAFFVVSFHGENTSLNEDYEDNVLQVVVQSEYQRIANGTPAEPGEFPEVVALEIHKPTEARTCTGTIIHEEYVLTSGSCVRDAEDIFVEIGCLHLENCNKTVYGTGMVHPNYEQINGIFLNDIGLVHLHEKMPDMVFSDINIPVLLGEDCMVVSYMNAVEENHDVTRKLFKQILHSILPCHQLAPNLHPSELHVLCAIIKPFEEVTLEEYGGPVLCGGVQVGIVSQSIKSTTEEGVAQDVITWEPVSEFKDWIQSCCIAATLGSNTATVFVLVFSLNCVSRPCALHHILCISIVVFLYRTFHFYLV